MFSHLKGKTKDAMLRILSCLANSTMIVQQVQTFSMADMPLVLETAPTAVLPDQGPQLYTQGQTKLTQTKSPVAKKSLNLGEPSDTMKPIVAHDMAVQTQTTEVPNTTDGTVGGVDIGTSLQTGKVA